MPRQKRSSRNSSSQPSSGGGGGFDLMSLFAGSANPGQGGYAPTTATTTADGTTATATPTWTDYTGPQGFWDKTRDFFNGGAGERQARQLNQEHGALLESHALAKQNLDYELAAKDKYALKNLEDLNRIKMEQEQKERDVNIDRLTSAQNYMDAGDISKAQDWAVNPNFNRAKMEALLVQQPNVLKNGLTTALNQQAQEEGASPFQRNIGATTAQRILADEQAKLTDARDLNSFYTQNPNANRTSEMRLKKFAAEGAKYVPFPMNNFVNVDTGERGMQSPEKTVTIPESKTIDKDGNIKITPASFFTHPSSLNFYPGANVNDFMSTATLTKPSTTLQGPPASTTTAQPTPPAQSSISGNFGGIDAQQLQMQADYEKQRLLDETMINEVNNQVKGLQFELGNLKTSVRPEATKLVPASGLGFMGGGRIPQSVSTADRLESFKQGQAKQTALQALLLKQKQLQESLYGND